MNNFEFNLRTRLKFGEGEALNLGRYLEEMSFKKAALIIDSGVFKIDYVQKVIESCKDKIKVWEYNLGGEPDYDSLDKIKLEFMNPLPDCFVAIGGGSVIDFAKGLATLVINPGEARLYRGFPENIQKPLPVIALPTTAGTGSEVTFNAAFIDWKENKKLGINSLLNFPILAILDPRLVSSCPRKIALSSGIDTLVHVCEAYASLKSGELTKSFAREGFKLIFENIEKALGNPNDLESWGKLQLGAYFGGLALLGSGGGPTGALSYALGVNFKVPHGLAGAVFLPYIVEYNVKNGYDYSGLYCSDLPLPDMLFDLYRKLKAPLSLKDFGVNSENMEVMMKSAEGLGGAFAQNPISFVIEDAKKLLLNLIK
jgi:alcohol dehydrogenase